MSEKKSVDLEICCYSYQSCVIAQQGNADRIELCGGEGDGGTTPSYGLVKRVLQDVTIPIYVMIRPRGGDFLYTADEIAIMEQDIKLFNSLGVAGYVFGCLTADGNVDIEANAKLIQAAAGRDCVFHRAFDMTRDQSLALEQIISLGYVRILTSGGMQNAIDGKANLSAFAQQAAGRIEIMPGSGVNLTNLLEIWSIPGIHAAHASLKVSLESGMEFVNPRISMSAGDPKAEYRFNQTDLKAVQAAVALKEQLR